MYKDVKYAPAGSIDPATAMDETLPDPYDRLDEAASHERCEFPRHWA
jgi:hypothetical protein